MQMRTKTGWVVVAGWLGALAACDAETPAAAETATDAQAAPVSADAAPLDAGTTTPAPPSLEAGPADDVDAVSKTTYSAHVRPILERSCLGCHAEGRIAPVTLETYEQAKAFAPLIAHVTRTRQMPPTSVDNTGECNTFRDLPWLSEEEIATLEAWAEEGAPEGEPSTAPAEAPPLPELTGDVRSVTTPAYVPSTELPDDYRCFVVDSPFPENTYVTGFDMKPGDLETAHHAVIFFPMDDLSAGVARVLDDLDEGPGYECFGSPSVPATILGAWAPGGGATEYPDDLGIEVAANRPLIIQMHYNTLGTTSPGEDQTEIRMSVRSDDVSPALFTQLLDLNMSAPAGQAEAEVAFRSAPSMPDGSDDVQIYGVFPHMHELGRSIQVSTTMSSGEETCLVDVPRYDFHWQRMYFYDSPITLDLAQEIGVRCVYDTTSRDTPVTWGEGTQDEMCVAGLLVKL